MSWLAFICELCAYIMEWTLSMSLYGALHIVCQAACPRGSHQFIFSLLLFAWDRPRSQGYITHSMCLQFFCLQVQISQVCVTSLCGPWAKVAYLYFIFSLCALHIYECNQLYQILFLSINQIKYLISASVQQVYFSIDILLFSYNIPF